MNTYIPKLKNLLKKEQISAQIEPQRQNLNRSISNVIEPVINISQQRKFQDQMASLPNSTKLIIFLKLFKNCILKGSLSFYNASITCILKPDRDTMKKKKSVDKYHW